MSTRVARAWVRKNHRTTPAQARKAGKTWHPSMQRWEVIYEDPTRLKKGGGFNQRTKGGFKTKRAAETWADDFTTRIKSGTYTDPERGTITFREFANSWFKTKDFKRARTHDSYHRIINGRRSRLNLTFGTTPLADITHEAVAEWVGDLSRALEAQTVRHYHGVLRRVLAYAVRTKRIPANPALDIDLPKVKKMHEAEEERYPLTPHETNLIISNLPEPYDTYTALTAATGMRPEEVAALTLQDLDLTNGTVRVRAVIVEVNAKRNTDNGGLIREEFTKTSHSRRTITLDTATTRRLTTYRKAHTARAMQFFTEHPATPHPGDDLPLFVGVLNGGKRTKGQPALPDIERLDFTKPTRHSAFTKKYWHPALKAAGLPPVRFYDLRHAHASLLVSLIGQPGALSLKEIQDRLGHDSAMMTLDRYAHKPKPDHDRTRNALDSALAPTPTPASNVTPLHGRQSG